MHKLARLSAAERRSLITEFIDDTFTGLDLGPGTPAGKAHRNSAHGCLK